MKTREETPSSTPPAPRRKAGRPLSFDREHALEQAMLTFWQYGYETTSLNELTAAMGITPPSLYSAFGDKEKLFLEAVQRYSEKHYGLVESRLEVAPTARAAIQELLDNAAIEHTSPCHPPGCMVATAVTNCTPASAHLQVTLAGLKEHTRECIVARLQRGIDEGELPSSANAAAMADFYLTVLSGMTTQARDHASCGQLQNTVAMAMQAWPAKD
jgi:AcrR family transcriptional regulator